MQFEKWQACGNDFIIVERKLYKSVIRGLCDRHFGIGADGVLAVLPPRPYAKKENADLRMIVYNKDGSKAEMCGNGIRCVARYYAQRSGKEEQLIDTDSGVKHVVVEDEAAMVDLALPQIAWGEYMKIFKKVYRAVAVDVGNPHCVLYTDDVRGGEVERVGSKFSATRSLFPYGANIEFVTKANIFNKTIRVRVWERGVGRTLGCGTGAVASAWAMLAMGECEGNQVFVTLDGGDVDVRVYKDHVTLTGMALPTFKGEIDDKVLDSWYSEAVEQHRQDPNEELDDDSDFSDVNYGLGDDEE